MKARTDDSHKYGSDGKTTTATIPIERFWELIDYAHQLAAALEREKACQAVVLKSLARIVLMRLPEEKREVLMPEVARIRAAIDALSQPGAAKGEET